MEEDSQYIDEDLQDSRITQSTHPIVNIETHNNQTEESDIYINLPDKVEPLVEINVSPDSSPNNSLLMRPSDQEAGQGEFKLALHMLAEHDQDNNDAD